METVHFTPIAFAGCKDFTLSVPIKEFMPTYTPMIDITLVTLTGKLIPLTISKYDTVERLKKRIYVLENLLIDTQQYVFQGKELNNLNTLDHYGIKNGDRVYFRIRLRGGMFHCTSARSDWVSINFITKLQQGTHMIQHMKSHGICLEVLHDLQRELEKCSTDAKIDNIFTLVEKYYVD